MTAPHPPDVPDYVLSGLTSRSPRELEAIAEYCGQLAEHKREPDIDDENAEKVDSEDVDWGDKEPDDIDTSKGVYLQKRRLDCGPGCDGCPHGPYLYAKYRKKDGSWTSEYVGKA
jgi:hypothetical protein